MKTVVLGNGYLGSEFKDQGFTVLGRDEFEVIKLPRDQHKYFDKILSEYDVIINCIATSNTRFCEEYFEEAYFTNCQIPAYLSTWCKKNGKKYVHISTGCLYDKNNIPQKETDFIAAHCNYTLSKWMGEKACQPQDLIIRPRLLFDYKDNPKNLLLKLKKYNRLTRELDSATSTRTVVQAVTHLLKAEQSGIFNVACEGYISMAEIGTLLGKTTIEEVSIDDVRKQQNLYIVNTIMDISKLKQFYTPSDIKEEIEIMNKGIKT